MSDRTNLIETITNQDKFSTFARFLNSSGAKEVLSGEGEFTVFVPTNDAFAKIPEAKINELLNEPNQTKLKALLSYHIVPGKWMAANLGSSPTRTSFTGEELVFTDSNGLRVNGASIQARNLEATNGVVHALDTVLNPTPTAVAASAAGASTQPAVTPTAPISAATPGTPAATGSDPLSAVPTAGPLSTPAKADSKPII